LTDDAVITEHKTKARLLYSRGGGHLSGCGKLKIFVCLNLSEYEGKAVRCVLKLTLVVLGAAYAEYSL
jgi:hypothetical protein